MISIRLTRRGNNKRPFYYIAVADSRFPIKGRFIEKIGFLNPIAKGKEERFKIDLNRILYWKKIGAKISNSVVKLLKEIK
ncbi:30S ribosomal protein S16 [Candidatus Johnevansia muelleri]|uniref:Small ribosomal subunit protein bS16 n=1 Tax=Candidatus Johnevansia muelleri TaxID=1495769 RepID=A0A078KH72_9GAMM|nr:30S ribosomal protein S16 [Candidatus Evansia muelleri]